VSLVAWRHVNLTGSFDFSATPTPIDLEALAARYSDPDFWHQSLQEADGDGPESWSYCASFYLLSALGKNGLASTRKWPVRRKDRLRGRFRLRVGGDRALLDPRRALAHGRSLCGRR
jgi:hypothetical protein